jgi:hypothetical protein
LRNFKGGIESTTYEQVSHHPHSESFVAINGFALDDLAQPPLAVLIVGVFAATVRYANAAGTKRVVSILGTDEVDLNRNHISWVSPLGRALMKSAAGDRVVLQAPGGTA